MAEDIKEGETLLAEGFKEGQIAKITGPDGKEIIINRPEPELTDEQKLEKEQAELDNKEKGEEDENPSEPDLEPDDSEQKRTEAQSVLDAESTEEEKMEAQKVLDELDLEDESLLRKQSQEVLDNEDSTEEEKREAQDILDELGEVGADSDEDLVNGEEGDKDLKDDPPQKDAEFNVYEETDGVFETREQLKETTTLLKENPELKEMIDFYKENGTLLPYLEATLIKPDEIGDIEILFEQFKSEHGAAVAKMSSSQLTEIFKEDVLSKYDLSSEDPARVALAEGRLTQAADKIRKELKEELALKILPKDRNDKEAEEKVKTEAKAKLDGQKNKLAFQLRKQVKDGMLKIKINEEVSVTQKVSLKKISELLDQTSDLSLFTDDKGDFDLEKMAILTDKEAFLQSVVDDSGVAGRKAFIRKHLKKRPAKSKAPEGKGKPKTNLPNWLDPSDPASWKGAKIVKRT